MKFSIPNPLENAPVHPVTLLVLLAFEVGILGALTFVDAPLAVPTLVFITSMATAYPLLSGKQMEAYDAYHAETDQEESA